MTGWRAHVDGSPAHVWPETDAIEHDLDGDDCPCGPTVDAVKRADGSVGWVVMHHALNEPILIACEGTGCRTRPVPYPLWGVCQMCGQVVDTDDEGDAIGHYREEENP